MDLPVSFYYWKNVIIDLNSKHNEEKTRYKLYNPAPDNSCIEEQCLLSYTY